MDYSRFSKTELSDILDVIQMSVACRKESDIIDITARVREMVCADNAVCALGEGDSVKLIKIVNQNYPDEWKAMYAAEEYFKVDPVIRFNFEHSRAHLWTEAMDLYREEPYVELMNKASEFGLKYGVASGICRPGQKNTSIFSFSAGTNHFDDHHKDMLAILTPHIHQALIRVCNIKYTDRKPLSAREKEVLKWMKEGKTNWEVSVILGISERTVKFHVQNISYKLNAVNKSHAIAIAMDSGLEV